MIYLGCGSSIQANVLEWILQITELSPRSFEEHCPVDEIRDPARTGGSEQVEMVHITMSDNSSLCPQRLPGRSSGHHGEQGEDPDLHAVDQSQHSTSPQPGPDESRDPRDLQHQPEPDHVGQPGEGDQQPQPPRCLDSPVQLCQSQLCHHEKLHNISRNS